METLEAARARVVLDRLAAEKEIAQNFFNKIEANESLVNFIFFIFNKFNGG